MYNSSGLIPSRFLILLAHFIICTTLLWSHKDNSHLCSQLRIIENRVKFQWENQTKFMLAMSIAVGMIFLEMSAFLFGLTMFNSTSALLSILCHSSASVLWSYFIFEGWQCGWFWWILGFGSLPPILYDSCIILNKPAIGWTKILVLAGFSTTIGGSLAAGYNIGVVNAPAGVIKPFCNQSVFETYGLVLSTAQLDFLWSSIVAIFLVGAAAGSLGGSPIADILGRRNGLIICQIVGFVAGLLFIFSNMINSVEILLLGRLLAGLSSGMITCLMPMYLMELSPSHLKGSLGALCPLGVCTGVLLGQVMSISSVLGNKTLWPYCFAFYLMPLVTCGIFLPFLPESPKYLFVIKKNNQLALQNLSKIRNMPICNLEQEIQELQNELQASESKNSDVWSMKRVLNDRKLRLPLILVCVLASGQQFSGINAVFYYSVTIYKTAGLSESGQQLGTIGAGICNLFMAIISVPIMQRFNRRLIMQLSLSSTAFFLLLLAVAIKFLDAATWMPYLSIVGVLGFVLCYGLGLGPVPYFIGSELFEVGPRPIAMALGSMSNWGGNFIIGLFFPLMNSCIGAASFVIFAVWVGFLFILVSKYLPETRGRDVAEVALLCQDGFASKPLSSPISRIPQV